MSAMPFRDYLVARCPDPNRSASGAWVLPEFLAHRPREIQAESVSQPLSDIFQNLNARWEEEYFNVLQDNLDCLYLHLDPLRTIREELPPPEDDPDFGVQICYSGLWRMTQTQKLEADRLKTENPDWEPGRCFRAAGGEWVFSDTKSVLANEIEGRAFDAHFQLQQSEARLAKESGRLQH